MIGKRMKFIALVLAASLLVSQFSEMRLYAVEEGSHWETEEHTERNIDDEVQSASEYETTTEMERNEQSSESAVETESGTQGSSESAAETESDMHSSTEEEGFSETETESLTEDAVMSDTEGMTESLTEDEAETAIEADIDYPCPKELEPEIVPYDENQGALTEKLVHGRRTRSVLPEKYDARDEGYLPAVRNQGSWGACWSFSLMGAMEVSAIRDIGIASDAIDLSERHLAYFGYNTGHDALDNANEDTMTHSPDNYYLTNGGNDIRGVVRLMNWNGAASENDYPYVTGKLPDALERTAAQDARLYLENAYRYDFAGAITEKVGEETVVNPEKKAEAIKVVKQMITDYGAVSWSYYSDSKYLNQETGAYYNNVGGIGGARTNHAIMAVGWDDHYAKENFKEGSQPENDGAWIIRNSWGESSGAAGYLYMSYEDVSLGSGNPVYAFTVCDSAAYDNNYFYGNTAFSSSTIAVRRAAQIFQIKSENAVREKLTAVSFLIGTSNVDYELQIYKNPDIENGKVTNPTSGTPMLDAPQTGTTSYAGLHTIKLDTPVTFDTDDYLAVVLTFPGTRPNMYFDRSYTSDGGRQKGVHIIAEGRSFYSSNLTSWTDNYANNRTFRINALTVNCDDVVKTPEVKKTDVTEAQGFDQLPQVTIQWSKCTDAQGYKLYRSEDNENYELIYTADRSVREYTDTLSERKAAQYFYKVEAVYSDGGVLSAVVSQRVKGVIEAPKLTLTSYDGYQAVFTWDAVSGAERYELWKLSDKESADSDAVRVAAFAADEERKYIVDTDGWELGNYYYKICAVYGNEQTTWNEAFINRNLIWKQNDYYRASFSWLPVEGAASYKLFHRVNGKTFSATTKNTNVVMSMKSTSYHPCDVHQYYIRAYDEAGSEIGAGASSTIVFQMTPDAVSIDGIEYDYADTITITWSGGLGAEKVAIYRSEDSSDEGELLAEIDVDAAAESREVSYKDTVYKGKTYWYHFVPIAIKTDGSFVEGQATLSDKTLTNPEPATLETVRYVEEKNCVSLAWKVAKGAEGYVIERSVNQNGFTVIAVSEGGETAAYEDQSVEAGNKYRYRVQSYFTSETGRRMTMPAENVLDVGILPEPVEFSTIAELEQNNEDKQNNRTHVTLSWNASEKAQSYAVYRSVISDGAPDRYECIAENITKGEYTDNTAVSDTSYGYKLIVSMNGLSSDTEKTTAKTITTKPVLTALEMSIDTVELAKDKEQAFKITPKPAHYPYEQELTWAAYDEDNTALEIVQKSDTLVINGVDGKAILSITNTTTNTNIQAICDSETVRITLVAAIDEIKTECHIFVYNNDFWVRGVKDLTYTGGALTQELEVYNGNRLLTQDIDYTVAYKNNVKVSVDETNQTKKPAVIVKGKGNYTGTQTIYFEILPEPASEVDKISLIKAKVKSIGTLEYQGIAIKPKPVVKLGSKTLAEGTDYILSYENNEGAGKATVVISGINDYKGTTKVDFTVNYNIQKDEANLMRIVFDTQDVPFAKGGAKPALQVYCGDALLTEGTDYKLSYKNNKAIAAASDKKAPIVVITGKGNYKGRREASFHIVKQDIGELVLTAKDKVYTGKAGKFTTSFSIVDKDGKKLSAGRDYDKKSIVYTYADTGEPVGEMDIVPQGTTLCITVNAADTGAYRGCITGEYRIAAYDIGKAKVSVEPQTYTGSEIEPRSDTGVKVTYKGFENELIEGVHYEITGYANNVKKGTAKLYIKGLGDFGGTKTVSFKIKTKTFQWWWQG